jgi:uncharacterized protein YbjT (DUF2867 family)
MKILICGANGFVGRHLTQILRQAGHRVFRGVRRPTQSGDVAMDYCTDTSKAAWMPRLEGVSVVINAVGVLRDSTDRPMAALHAETPAALFAACAASGVERIVQFSALGVGTGVDTPYFSTRQAAEDSLQLLPDTIHRLVLRPSLIYGHDGVSAKMFRLLARLPLHVLPMGGRQIVQPVHIDDIGQAVKCWLDDRHAKTTTVAAVGAEPTTLRGMLDSYRMQMHRPPAIHVPAPSMLMRLAAYAGDHIPASPLCSDTLTMLAAGNSAESTDFSALLGRPPRSYRHFIAQEAPDGCSR